MAITKSEFSAYIRDFQFRELFNEMGWNNDRTKQVIVVDADTFSLTGIAEKSGFRIFVCEPAGDHMLPDTINRKKIEHKVTKLFHEHLIIYIDENKQEQIWQLAVRKAGSPTKISETRYSITQDPELLYQRASGIFFTLDEEEKITIIDVTKRVTENFQQNNERVTKKFYDRFRKEHTAFMKFIKGIDDQFDMDWYASLMLNRLMFCYFIQKKGFLDNNRNYLQDKLKACKEKKGKDKFYSFYRDFLLALFHKGLGAPEHSRKPELEIGKIPYLNGGLFDEHEIERIYKKISIEDKAFEKLFDFFDEYEWHLDTRASASGKEINPDVIGYIFEKYINDRAQMGAYYTKEDITDYIAKNCIIPWLFDEVKRQYPEAFTADAWLWQMLKASGTDYIYDAVKKGVPEKGGLFSDLPPEIQKGFAPELEKKVVDGNGSWLWELRKEWNKPAPPEIALPTEIYREVIERRRRYADIKLKIENGEIKEINDFITYNLNIRQFAQDVIELTGDAEFIRHFYRALCSITILDPTCGSGAFLFAALNILELLYEACIVQMRGFSATGGKRYKFFGEVLKQVDAPAHPNQQYFIFKSIILNNLYGVDIMKEAVEIAKLRLFLKLVATVEVDYRKPNLGLEPLPDVDFNIRAGNTLVGYATEKQIKEIFAGRLDFDNDEEKINEKCDIVGRAFARYKEIQLQGDADFTDFTKAKDDLNDRLRLLRDELNVLLHKQHYANTKYDQWLSTHQPFHWFAEFYEIIKGRGGFDVVIGNPPYVEYSKVNYKLYSFITIECGNLYAFIIEKCFSLLHNFGYFGMITPISLNSTERMKAMRNLLFQNILNIISFADRPSCLFSGVHQILTIFTLKKGNKTLFSNGGFHHWSKSERDFLFTNIVFHRLPNNDNYINYKIFNQTLFSIINKTFTQKRSLSSYFDGNKNLITYSGGTGGYWLRSFDEKQSSNEYKIVHLNNKELRYPIIGIINSTLFYLHWRLVSDCRHLTKNDIFQFNFNFKESLILSNLSAVAKNHLIELKQTNELRKGDMTYEQYRPAKTKPLIDQIDCLLAQHYGFTHEELDFIINYDIKYRMGKELEKEDDE